MEEFTPKYRETNDIRSLLIPMSSQAEMPVPARLPVKREEDPLGLVVHERLHDEFARIIGHQLGHITRSVISSDPKLRAQMLTGSTIQLPEVSMQGPHRFALECAWQTDGRITYGMHRTDLGTPEDSGGFFAVCSGDDAWVIKRNLETADPEESGAVLKQASLLTQAYANTLKVPLPDANQTLVSHATFSLNHISELTKQAKKEAKRSHRMLAKSKQLGRTALLQATKLVTTKKTEAGVVHRTFSPAKLALSVSLLPLPFFAEDISNTPIPRPLGVEIASDTIGGVEELLFSESPTDIYDAQGIDLPRVSALPADGQAHSINVIPPFEPAASAPIIDLSQGSAVLSGNSPRLITLGEGNLEPGKCIGLPLRPDLVDDDIVLATTNPNSSDLTITRTQASLQLCNDGAQTANTQNLDLLFDTK